MIYLGIDRESTELHAGLHLGEICVVVHQVFLEESLVILVGLLAIILKLIIAIILVILSL